jgi:hypothetical protein
MDILSSADKMTETTFAAQGSIENLSLLTHTRNGYGIAETAF